MITFRHYLLSLIAIFAALAVGIVLGAGPLTGRLPSSHSQAAAPSTPERDPRQEKLAEFAQAYAAATSPVLTAGALSERAVAIVTLPGADPDVVAAITDRITGSGGSVNGVWSLLPALLNTDQRTLVDTLGSQLVSDGSVPGVSADATTYDRIGQLIGLSAATTKPNGEGSSSRGRALLEALRTAKLVDLDQAPARRAPLLLIVLGTPPSATDSAPLIALVAGLTKTAQATVVAGSLADGEGQLAWLRAADTAAATVDSADTSIGQSVVALALVRGLTTSGGAFGAYGADGPVPLG